jgi:hypothetical protein
LNVDGESRIVKVLLAEMTFTDVTNTIVSKRKWVADRGATNRMAPYDNGMVDMVE